MTASRFRAAARIGLVLSLGLLAVSLNRCSLHREYVRRGVVLDSLAVRTERNAETQLAFLRDLRAQTLTELETIQRRIDELEARLIDLDERLARIGRRLGVWYEANAETETPPDTERTKAESTRTSIVPPSFNRAGIDPDQLYNTAYLDFTRGKYQLAVAGFDQFLQNFPDSDLADNAQYWKAECYYSMNDLTRAEEEFKLVLTKYPTGNKIASAAYKLGLVYLAQNRQTEAKRQLQEVIAKYPGTTEAKLAQERLSSLE